MKATSSAGATAKLFKNGRSQAVRLPKEFRLPGNEVLIRREAGSIVLTAKEKTVGEAMEGFWQEHPSGLAFERPTQPSMPSSKSL
jgi:antitoxin VapB